LSAYPAGLLDSPPERTTAALTAAPGGPALAGGPAPAAPPSVLPRGADRWTQALTELVEQRDLTVPFGALALAIALGLGALHALAPGHGKTLMAAAAAAGGRSSLREVLTLGASVTVTHTLGVFALGALIAAGSSVAPSVVGWLGVASGMLVTVAGALLVRRAWHNRAHQHGHTHVHWLGGGHAHHHHHDHDHGHERADDHAPGHEHRHDHEPAHEHGPEHAHEHGRERGKPQPLRRSVLLGFAGGLVPSPSAVVVLVGAAALGHAWFGFLLVVAYGAGLALTLTVAGFAVVRIGARVAARLARRRTTGRLAGFVQRSAPLSTAVAVFVLGCGLVLRGAAGAMS
ncbi:HoxN/HupN/NixA family nickel/cobalt transporter, partial [Streptomyces sp. NPDC054841]